MFKKLSIATLALMIGVSGIIAQDAPVPQQTDAQLRSLTSGMKYKIKGAVVSKDDDNTFIVRDTTGVDTRVTVAPEASIKTKGGWFGGGDRIASNQIVRGLYMTVEGRGAGDGSLAATKIRFDEDDFRVAQSIDTRVSPAEERLTVAEQNQQRISGQIDELMAISNAARGGAKAAQETADAAVAGVNATNARISALDEYVVQSTATVNFRVGSAVLSPEAKASLDEVATAASGLKGYEIEITGFASSDGGTQMNKKLSQRRAQAVIDYLVETHNVPLRRIGQSFGFGELQAVGDNTTREGREQNRRVEVKLLVSRGLNQNVEVRPVTSETDNN
ncbi:MAG TPA: OmpA family protein [Pyrinomonadaceae bacterium]|nr:OmpA family protein [Pyrinomonadaceae bacterium]